MGKGVTLGPYFFASSGDVSSSVSMTCYRTLEHFWGRSGPAVTLYLRERFVLYRCACLTPCQGCTSLPTFLYTIFGQKSCLGAIYELKLSKLFNHPLVVAIVSKIFAFCLSNVSPIMTFYSRFNIICSIMSRNTDLVPLCTFWTDVLKLSSNRHSKLVASPIVSISFTSDVLSCLLTSSSLFKLFSLWWLSTLTVASSLNGASIPVGVDVCSCPKSPPRPILLRCHTCHSSSSRTKGHERRIECPLRPSSLNPRHDASA